MIENTRDRVAPLPHVTVPLTARAAAAALAVALHALMIYAAFDLAGRRLDLEAALLRQARRPPRLSLVPLVLIVAAGWTTIALPNYGSELAMSRYGIDTKDNLQAGPQERHPVGALKLFAWAGAAG